MQTVFATQAASHRRYLTSTSGLRRAAFFSLSLAMLPVNHAMALPSGGQVVGGSATIHNPSAGHVVINQTTGRAIINWRDFDILNGESARFNQPGANSIALNRINNGNATQILGNLSANGRVVIVNPNGVFFGVGSRVDVAGMVATTADTSNANFMAGKLKFDQAGRADASIINKGTITAAQGGLVALVAPGVRNDGVIQAKLGTVALGSAKTVAIDMYGDNLYSFALGQKTDVTPLDENGNPMKDAVANAGKISAQGGNILLTANAAQRVVDNVVNNTGILEASAARVEGGTIVLDGGSEGNVNVSGTANASGNGSGQKGGTVTVTGKHIKLANANVDVSGTKGGGKVHIGGGYQGSGPLAHAASVTVDSDSSINANATGRGNGGQVVLWSDGLTDFNGAITAKGGSISGNGGTVETSGAELNVTGTVNASSAFGSKGMWLLDPRDITITGLPNVTLPNFQNVRASSIVSSLNGGTDVTVQTGGVGSPGSAVGNISVLTDVVWSGSGDLSLLAANNINVSNDIRSTYNGAAGSGGNILLNAGNSINVGNLLGNVDVSSASGNIDFTAGNDIAITADGLGSSRITAGKGDITLTAGDAVTLHSGATGNDSNVVATLGNILVNAKSLTLDTLSSAIGGDSYMRAGNNLTATITNNVDLLKGAFLQTANGALKVLQNGIFHSDNAGSLRNNAGGTGSILVNQNVVGLTEGSIQNAIDAIGTVGSNGATVKLGNGTFHQTAVINKSLNLVGSGAGNTTIAGTSLAAAPVINNGAPWASQTYQAVVTAQNASNVNVSGLTIDATGVGSNGTAALAYTNSGGTVANTTLKGGTFGLYTIASSLVGDIARTVIANNVSASGASWAQLAAIGDRMTINVNGGNYNGTGGVLGMDISNGTQGSIVGASITSGSSAGIALHGAHDLSITGNTITGNGSSTGIKEEGPDYGVASGTTINASGNTITNSAVGVSTNGGSDWTINGNTITGGTTAIRVNGTNNVTANSNIISGATNGITVASATGVVDVSSNSITGNGDQNGIAITNTDDATLTGNILDFSAPGADFWAGTGTAISLNNADNTIITGGSITNAFGMGGIMARNSDDLFVNGGTTISGGKIGVGLYNGSDRAVINFADLRNLYVGIDAQGVDSLQAFHNNFDNTATGILVNNSTGTIALLTNTMTSYNGEGIKLTNTDGAMVYNNVMTGTATGIIADNSDNTDILGGKITSNATGTGVRVLNSSGVKIGSLHVAGGRTGIFLNGSTGANLSRNYLNSNGGYTGILADNGSSGLTAFKNEILGYGNGIGVYAGSHNATLEQNTVTGGNGLEVYWSNGLKALKNVISASGRGIATGNGNGVTITDNVITTPAYASGNTDTGITVASATGIVDVSRNTITQPSGKTGIHIKSTAGATLTGNTITGGNRGIWIDGSNGAQVTGGTITGATTGIRVNPSDGVVIDGTTVNGGTTGVELVTATNAEVKNTHLNNQTNGIAASSGSTGLKAHDNTITGAGNGILVAGNSHGAVLEHNTIGAANGIALSYSNGAQVLDNTITATIAGIKAVGVNGVNMVLNTVTGATTGLSVTDSTGNVTLRRNTITGNGDENGINITRTANAIVKNNDIDLSTPGADFWAGTGTAIALNQADGTEVTGNGTHGIIKNAFGTNGVIINDSDHVLVDGVTVLGGRIGVGIYNGSKDTTVTDNVLKNLYVGVDAVNVKDVKANRNTLDNVQNGIFFKNVTGDAIAKNNTMNLYSMQDGIHLVNTHDAVIGDNSVTGANHGIWMEDSNRGHVYGGRIINTKTGVMVDSSNHTDVTGVTVDGGTIGIGIYNGSRDTLAKDNILRNLYVGVDAVNVKDVRANGNNVDNVQNGIFFNNVTGDAIAKNNTMQLYSMQDGIHLVNTHDAELTGNSIGGANHGIWLEDSNRADITGGDLHHNKTAVLIDSSNRAVVDGVLIRRNEVGVAVDNGSRNTGIINNRIRRNSIAGIQLGDTKNVVIGGNRLRNNAVGIEANGSENVAILGNRFRNNVTGISLTDVDGAVVVLNDLHANANGITGIEVDGGDKIFLGGNHILGYGDAINADDVAPNGLIVVGNTIEGGNATVTDSDGVRLVGNDVFDGGISVDNSDNARIIGNYVDGGEGVGIALTNSENGRIRGNSVFDRTVGYLVSNVQSLLFNGNRAQANGTGAQLTDVSDATIRNNRFVRNEGNGMEATRLNGATFDNNRFRRNVDGLSITDSSGILLMGNRFTRNARGVALLRTDGTTLTGDIFTGNTLGLDLNNSANTLVDTATFTNNDTALRIGSTAGGNDSPGGGNEGPFMPLVEGPTGNPSSGTIVRNSIFTGGDIAILLSGEGSSMQFEGNTSRFDGMDYYFVLENGAMFGNEINASQQFFAGVRGVDFTYDQLVAAEGKTIDRDDTTTIGNVFYSNVQPPVNPPEPPEEPETPGAGPSVDGISALDEFQRNRNGLYRTGLFSYAGKTLVDASQNTRVNFSINNVNLSLLNNGTQAGNTASIAGRFAALAPAAGGNGKPNAADFANLKPAAGGNQQFAQADAALGASQGCGNSFLGEGFEAGFNAGSCSAQ